MIALVFSGRINLAAMAVGAAILAGVAAARRGQQLVHAHVAMRRTPAIAAKQETCCSAARNRDITRIEARRFPMGAAG